MLDVQDPYCAGKNGGYGPKKNSCQEKTEFRNIAKMQGILLAQVVNIQILKIQDIAIFAAKFSNVSFAYELVQKILKLAEGKFRVGQGKHREFANRI